MSQLKRKIIFYMLTKQKALTAITVLIILMATTFASPGAVYAEGFDPEESGKSVLRFFALLILCAAGFGLIKLIASGHIVPAVILLAAAAFFYVVLDPDIMKEIGAGIKSIMKIKNSGNQ